MRCRWNHEHPPKRVVAAHNPIEPEGRPRPFHCPSGYRTRQQGKRKNWWKATSNPTRLRDKAGRPRRANASKHEESGGRFPHEEKD